MSGYIPLKDYFRDKENIFLKQKTEEDNKKNRFFSYQSGMLLPFSGTYFKEISSHVSEKVVTNDSFRDNETMKT